MLPVVLHFKPQCLVLCTGKKQWRDVLASYSPLAIISAHLKIESDNPSDLSTAGIRDNQIDPRKIIHSALPSPVKRRWRLRPFPVLAAKGYAVAGLLRLKLSVITMECRWPIWRRRRWSDNSRVKVLMIQLMFLAPIAHHSRNANQDDKHNGGQHEYNKSRMVREKAQHDR